MGLDFCGKQGFIRGFADLQEFFSGDCRKARGLPLRRLRFVLQAREAPRPRGLNPAPFESARIF